MTTSPATAATATKLSGSRLKLETSTPTGRGLVCPDPAAAGTLLLRLDPLISILDTPFLDKACSTCFTPSKTVDPTGSDLQYCTGCGIMRYCSRVTTPSPPPRRL